MMNTNKHRRWIIYLISCLLFNFSQFYRSSIAVISPNLIQDLGLDTKDLGFISAAFFYSFAVMQIPVGLFLDYVGPRIFMTLLSLIAVAGALMFAWGESVAMLVFGRLLLGMGMSCNLMGSLKLVTTWFSPRYFATLSAIFFSVGTAGNIVAATPLVWLTGLFGWRMTFVFMAVCNLIIAVVFFLLARDHPEDGPDGHANISECINLSTALGGVVRLFTRLDYWLISIGTFFRYGVYAAVQALWAAPFLMISMGHSQIMTGNLLLVMSIGLIISSPVSGWISDTVLYTRKPIIIAALAVMGGILISLALAPASTGLVILFALFFCFGVFSGAGQLMYTHIKERMPVENAGAAMTGINFFTVIGVAFFLHGLGYLINHFYPEGILDPAAFRMVFLLFGMSLAIAALLYALTAEGLDNRES